MGKHFIFSTKNLARLIYNFTTHLISYSNSKHVYKNRCMLTKNF